MAGTRIFGGVLSIIALALASSTQATTHIVPDDFNMQAALDTAASGDTVLVKAGTYSGGFSFSGKDLVVIGESGSASTILDANFAARVFEIGAGVTTASHLRGLTFYRGSAVGGGGVRVETNSGVTITESFFHDNASQGFEGGPGAGIFGSGGSDIVVDQCLFDDNLGGTGAGIYTTGSLTVSNSTFRNAFGRIGTAIFAQNSPSILIESCSMYDNESWVDGGTLVLLNCVGLVTGNTIAFNDNPDPTFGAVQMSGGPLTARQNIIANNEGIGLEFANVTVECNDSWNNTGVSFSPDVVGVDGNFSDDPLFCNTGSRDFTLLDSSPCRFGFNPGCGLIGRFGIGCTTIAVEPTTWSRIKSMRR